MNNLSKLVGLGLLGFALLVSAGTSQEKKDDKKSTKGQLPAGFKNLNLTAEQKAAIYKINTEYQVKISELDSKITELKNKRTLEQFKVLTDDQKKKYLESKGAADSNDKKDTKKDDKK